MRDVILMGNEGYEDKCYVACYRVRAENNLYTYDTDHKNE